ncbi:MAG: VanZ family protein [Clostridia bacterium]|nr:VanZ family protein [Clostridia bacterium]
MVLYGYTDFIISLFERIYLMEKIKIIRLILLLSVILLMIVIFMLSAQGATESSNLSSNITEKIAEIIIPSLNKMPIEKKLNIIEELHLFVRKTAHATAYFFLGIMCILLMQTYKIKNIYKIIIALGICLVYAISDELHQALVPGRGPSVYDVGIDFSGSIVGVLVIMLIIIIYKNIKVKLLK